ncbi:hypothetical protein [Vallicoccus soli]|uniref:DUF1542 domain-containing protein n=1 Tax=Vallicoccus soli TaxID=2339232 RepID=A0A3A3YUW7_9ACTN|nr:hypothetical protein [Vallicoccus soli]RJK95311.1 hypothetical protein D5H78_11620 [Vallicoccus soli]
MDQIVLLLVLVGIVVAGVVAYRSSKRKAELQAAEELAAVRGTVEEDVTRLGEEVAELDLATAGRELDQGGRQDYQRALDEYDRAKQALDRVRRPEDVKAVTEALEDGRYAAACVRARVDGRPLPVRRPPCFFNPQHGPSVEDVEWAPPGGQLRPVPVCLPDAERVRAGAEPDARKVPVAAGGRRPYWEAGPQYGSYAQGYFAPYAASGLLPGFLLGAAMTGAFSGGWDGSYSEGYEQGLEDGGGDDGGGDGGGADWGGGDGGWGGDGGGFDF